MTHLHDAPVTGRTVLVTGATSGIEQVSGRYFADRRPTRSSTRSYDQVVAARLWGASADLGGLTAAPRV
jgi:retinol dehydrogenase 14